MSITPDEARSALHDIRKTEDRAAASEHGRYAAPHLILWGVIWMLGYGASALRPDLGLIWPPLVLAGMVGGFVIGMRAAPGDPRGEGWRYGLSLAVLAAFIIGVMLILPPQSASQGGAFIPLLVGLCYALMGIWSKGWRMLPLGLAITALTVASYLWLPEQFALIMAVVGGGGLIVGGLWLRRA